MSNLLMFLDETNGISCDLGDPSATNGLLLVLYYIRLVVRILQIVVPIGLILMGTIDMGKAVIAGDEKKMAEAKKPFVKRIISAVIVFCIPFLVNVFVSLVTTNTEYKGCWDAAKTKPEGINFGGNSMEL